MAKLISIGEALIDQVKQGVKLIGRFTGGAPTNVAAMVAKLGQSSVLLTKIGDDDEGKMIIETLRTLGVDTNHVKVTDAHDTTIAKVQVDKKGQRTFTFDRRNAADLFLTKEDIDPTLFEEGDILHFGSVNLVPSLTRKAHEFAIDTAKKNGVILSFDPNLRFNLWPNPLALREAVKEFMIGVDIFKVTEEELNFIFPDMSIEAAIEKVFQAKITWLILSKGDQGLVAYQAKQKPIIVKGNKVKVVDTTGAGDALIGALLTKILVAGISKAKLASSGLKMKEFLTYANDVAALSTTKSGAIESFPSQDDLKKAKIK
jgi:fructokinase